MGLLTKLARQAVARNPLPRPELPGIQNEEEMDAETQALCNQLAQEMEVLAIETAELAKRVDNLTTSVAESLHDNTEDPEGPPSEIPVGETEPGTAEPVPGDIEPDHDPNLPLNFPSDATVHSPQHETWRVRHEHHQGRRKDHQDE